MPCHISNLCKETSLCIVQYRWQIKDKSYSSLTICLLGNCTTQVEWSKTLTSYRKFMFIYPYCVHIGRWGFDLYGHFQQCSNVIVTALLIRRGNVRQIQGTLRWTSSLRYVSANIRLQVKIKAGNPISGDVIVDRS